MAEKPKNSDDQGATDGDSIPVKPETKTTHSSPATPKPLRPPVVTVRDQQNAFRIMFLDVEALCKDISENSADVAVSKVSSRLRDMKAVWMRLVREGNKDLQLEYQQRFHVAETKIHSILNEIPN